MTSSSDGDIRWEEELEVVELALEFDAPTNCTEKMITGNFGVAEDRFPVLDFESIIPLTRRTLDYAGDHTPLDQSEYQTKLDYLEETYAAERVVGQIAPLIF